MHTYIATRYAWTSNCMTTHACIYTIYFSTHPMSLGAYPIILISNNIQQLYIITGLESLDHYWTTGLKFFPFYTF